MARSQANKDLTASMVSGSEEIFDFFCQPCSTEKHIEAVGYCQQCSLYLCDTCVHHHGKLPITANHTVLDKASMPKTKLPSRPQICDNLTETCKEHPGKILEYYCKVHDTISCSVCLTLGHASCSDKSYIPDISGGVENSLECKNRRAQLDRLIREITEQLSNINGDVQTNERWRSNALTDIKELRQHFNKLIDEIEENTRKQVLKLYQENKEILKKTAKECQALLSEVKSMAADIERNSNVGKANQLFVQLKISSPRIADVQRQVTESGLCKANKFALRHGENLQQTKSTLSALWSLDVRTVDTPTKARYLRKLNVKSADDKQHCSIRSVVVLTGSRIVVTDYNNEAVKLVDTKLNKITSCLSMSSQPFDAIEMDLNKLAVALKMSKIEIISVTASLSITKTIQTPGARYCGLGYDGTNFITMSTSQRNMKIIDMTGNILSTISTDSHGQQLFSDPRNVALGRNKDVVYITDCEANTVTCMTTKGRVIWVYTHDKLKYPRGVSVGPDGSVYVCSRDTHTVHQLSSTGGLTRIILSHEQDLVELPYAIKYDEEGDMLYISSNSGAPNLKNYIRVYQLV